MNDLISRQAAIDAFLKAGTGVDQETQTNEGRTEDLKEDEA